MSRDYHAIGQASVRDHIERVDAWVAVGLELTAIGVESYSGLDLGYVRHQIGAADWPRVRSRWDVPERIEWHTMGATFLRSIVVGGVPVLTLIYPKDVPPAEWLALCEQLQLKAVDDARRLAEKGAA